MDKINIQILSLLQKNCRLSNSSIAKTLNLSKDTIRLRIKKLEEEKIITHYNTIIDARPLGFCKHHVLIQLSDNNVEDIIKKIKKLNSVTFANSFIGKYDLHVIMDNLTVEDFVYERQKLLNMIGNYKDYIFFRYLYDLKHNNLIPETNIDLNQKQKLDSSFSKILFEGKNALKKYESYNLDKLNIKLLNHLCNYPRSTLSEMATLFEVNRETIKNRISNLIKKKIILNFGANISFEKFGYTTYCLLLKVKNLDKFVYSPNIYYSAVIDGRFNLIIYLLAKDTYELRTTLEKLDYAIDYKELLIFDNLFVYTQFLNFFSLQKKSSNIMKA